jgi:LPXTG-motif cell wall-anchored protein
MNAERLFFSKKISLKKAFGHHVQTERTFVCRISKEPLPVGRTKSWENSNRLQRKEIEMAIKKKIRKNFKRILSGTLALVMLLGLVPSNVTVASAVTTAKVSLTSLGRKGTVSIGKKTKSGTWWQMHLNGKKAFCINLGYTCHTGNTYAAEQKYSWNQDTGGEKNGYYAKIIRWYVVDKNRSNKAFVLSQALIWSVAEGRNSETQLKDVIKQVKDNTNVSPNKTAGELYKQIFEPDGDWTAEATIWQKTGNSKSYQKLLTVDAEENGTTFSIQSLNENTYYRQRITVLKKDEDGKGLGGIQFTLDADNLDDLYSFSMTDRDGTESSDSDDNDDTSFSLTGYTKDSGRIAYRMTYKLQSTEYYYIKDSDLDAMSAEEKKTAKEYLTDRLELEEGVDFASGMTKAGAEKLAKQELKDQKEEISNTYTLTEDNTGDNQDIILDSEFAKGVTITLDKDYSWEKNSDGVWADSLEEIPSEYSKAYVTGVTNKYKKATIDVVKTDKYSSDKKAHGDASLEGAEFQLYAEQDCTNKATVYNADGSKKTADVYRISGGKLETDYLRSGTTYYLKEVKAPEGYTLAEDVLPIKADTSGVTAEYTKNLTSVEFGNQPILGKVAIQKYYSDGETGEIQPEANATFQIMKKGKTYEECDDYERDTIKTDENGYAVTKDLYYGEYQVHQVDSGDVDAVMVSDFDATIDENGKTYTYALNNNLFKAYLRILKKDGKTQKQVLKAGTTYRIYKVTDKGEELVTQSYSNGNRTETVDTFVTDASGEIMTVKPLKSATYRIYETESAEGLHISEEFIEVTINSKADNYESYTDEDGNTHMVVTVTYTNEETYAKLAVKKTGEVLSGWDGENRTFLYENRTLKGAEFTIYADGDIATQDNQGDTWFHDGDKVATIITGEKAEFTSDCNGICNQSVDEDGTVHITLPLGKYRVKETKTLYGYVFPEENEWNLSFTWENGSDEFVLNSTEATDKDGTMNIKNTLAKPVIELLKEDADSKESIEGAVFGLYASDDIYNADGVKIVEAGTELTTLTTGEDGTAKCTMALPLMDEGYLAMGSAVSAVSTQAAVNVSEAAVEVLNSGDYYLKEISVPGSYYLDEEPVPVHLEYKDADTGVISMKVVKENKQTTNEVDKVSAGDSGEIDGCELVITDAEGNEIIQWTSGDTDSVKLSAAAEEYVNLKTYFDENGNLHVGGLLHDTEYTLTEKRPADGYVTADSIVYMLKQSAAEDGTVQTVVSVKQEDGTFSDRDDDKTIMVDEQTTIRLIKLDGKTGQGLSGAKFTVTDADGNEVMKLVSTEDGVDITGKLIAGQTYTFTETSAPKGYTMADPITYTVKDTAKVQKVSVTDERISKSTTSVPQTGGQTPFIPLAVGFIMSAGAAAWTLRRRKAGK